MNNAKMVTDIPRKTVLMLLVLTILVSVLGTLTVIKATESYNKQKVADAPITDEIKGLNGQSESTITLTIIEPPENK